jgi:DNA topoisomerase-1
VVKAIESVAKRLGNTPSVCRKCYIHPGILDTYLDGTMLESLRRQASEEMSHIRGLSAEESAVLALLQRRLAEEDRHDRSARAAARKARARAGIPESPRRAASRP